MSDRPAPWWANDPVLEELKRRTWEEFEEELDRREPLEPSQPDPVLSDIFSGACRRELRMARDGLADARERYDHAVRKARTAGLSWGEIGAVLGVARQELHRRYRAQKPGATTG